MTTTDIDLTGFYADSTKSGLIVPTSATLSATITAGIVYINQAKVDVSADAKTYTATKDTYVDVGDDGVITYTEAVIDATAPALAADAVRLAKVITDGTTVASVVDMRTITVTNKYVFGEISIGSDTAMNLYNKSNAPVYVRFGSGSTSAGIPIKPFTSIDVAETVYAKPSSDGSSLLATK